MRIKLKGEEFFKENSAEWEKVGEGITRQIVGFNSQLMLVKVKFEKGAVGTLHSHFHTQGTYVASGEFKVTIDGRSEILQEGDGFLASPNAMHGAECLKPGVLVDTFSPIREDFLK